MLQQAHYVLIINFTLQFALKSHQNGETLKKRKNKNHEYTCLQLIRVGNKVKWESLCAIIWFKTHKLLKFKLLIINWAANMYRKLNFDWCTL